MPPPSPHQGSKLRKSLLVPLASLDSQDPSLVLSEQCLLFLVLLRGDNQGFRTNPFEKLSKTRNSSRNSLKPEIIFAPLPSFRKDDRVLCLFRIVSRHAFK